MADPLIQALRDWQNFYMLTGTASAALIGLIFVAMSLGTGLKFHDTVTTVHTWVTPIIIQFGIAFLISALITVPTLTVLSLVVFLGAVGLVVLGYVLSIGVRFWRQRRSASEPVSDFVWYAVLPAVSCLLILGTAVGLLLGAGQVLSGLALAVLLLMVLGIRNAWSLTLWLAQKQQE